MVVAGFRPIAFALLCVSCTSIYADSRTFDGTRWRVTAVNGHATPPRDPFFVEFLRSSYRARVGCNEARGQYRIERRDLIPAGMMTTEMACEAVPATGIPLMTYEQWGFRVLRQPMRMHWSSARRLRLSNASGSLDLEQAL
jgi:heat shock protein HslJ